MRATDAEKAVAEEIISLFRAEKHEQARAKLDVMLRDSNHPRFRRIEARFLLFEGEEQQAANILKDIILKVWKPGAWELALADIEVGRARFADDAKLMFFPVRKCGSTSVLNILKMVEGEPVRGEHIHREDTLNKPVKLGTVLADYPDYFSFALVRDPVARLVSYHRGNIIARNQIAAHHDSAVSFYGLPTQPDWGFFMENIGRYRQVFVTARNHTDPLASFLGHDPSRFSWLGGLHDMPALVAALREKTGVDLPMLNDMASPESATNLPEIPDSLAALYADDHRLYGQYF